jgi:hypothetical protein
MQESHIFEVEMPDGNILEIDAPANTPQDQIRNRAKQYMQGQEVERALKTQPPKPVLPRALQSPPSPGSSTMDLMMGVNPSELGERFKGVGQSIGNTALAGLQWGQNALGANVTPTPMALQPNTPGQKLGSDLGTAGQYAGLTALTGGASLPAQVATGGVGAGVIAGGAGQDVGVASKIGMAAPIAAVTLGKAVGAVRQYLDDKKYASAIYNKVARVPTGQGGIQAGEGTAFKTDPGRTMADRGVTAWSAPQLKVESERALTGIGDELTAKLRTVTTPMDVAKVVNPQLPQVQAALKEVGVNPAPLTSNDLGNLTKQTEKPIRELLLTAEQAHRFRSALGKYIDWNPNATMNVQVASNPNLPLQITNEELKNSYFAINNMIDATVNGVKPINKAWQEAYLYTRALTDRIEYLHGSQFGMPGSTVTGMVNRYMFSAPATKLAQLLKYAQSVLSSTAPPGAGAAAQGALLGAQPQQ